MPKPTLSIKARGFKKKVIEKQVYGFQHAIFVVRKDREKKDEQDLVIRFKHPVRHRVVKLDSRGLPRKDPHTGESIAWISNFAILDRYGNYVDGEPYTLFLPALPAPHIYVTYEKGQVKPLPLCPIIGPSEFVLAELALGDPPVGIRPKDGTEPIIPETG